MEQRIKRAQLRTQGAAAGQRSLVLYVQRLTIGSGGFYVSSSEFQCGHQSWSTAAAWPEIWARLHRGNWKGKVEEKRREEKRREEKRREEKRREEKRREEKGRVAGEFPSMWQIKPGACLLCIWNQFEMWDCGDWMKDGRSPSSRLENSVWTCQPRYFQSLPLHKQLNIGYSDLFILCHCTTTVSYRVVQWWGGMYFIPLCCIERINIRL